MKIDKVRSLFTRQNNKGKGKASQKATKRRKGEKSTSAAGGNGVQLRRRTLSTWMFDGVGQRISILSGD